MLFAHAKWFVADPDHYRPDVHFLLSPLTVLPLVAIVVAVAMAAARGAGASRPGGAPSVSCLLPRALAAAAGATAVMLAVQHRLLVPDVALHHGGAGAALAVAELGVGLWLLSGVAPVPAAWGLLALSVTLAAAAPGSTLLEAAYYPGIAVYLVLNERALAGRVTPEMPWRALAATLGASLVTVAFTEKLAYPAITLTLVHAHPGLDPLALVGAALPPATFVRMAGLVEVLLGLLIATGVGGRALALVAIGPFVATVALFGAPEVVGHLPIYVALLTVAARSDPVHIAARRPGVR